MNRLTQHLLIVTCLFTAHCGPSRSADATGSQQASSTADAGPKRDCPPPAVTACTTQADCPQNSGGPDLYSCLQAPGGDVCTFEGQYDSSCSVVQPFVQVSAQLDPSIASSAGWLLFRAIYPELADGTAADCASIIQRTSAKTGSPLNTMLTLGVGVPTSSQTVVGFAAALVPVSGAVLSIEAWSGPLDETTQQPTGDLLGSGCAAGQDIEGNSSRAQQITVLVSAAGT